MSPRSIAIGELRTGDVLIDGAKIAAVGPNSTSTDTMVVDATGQTHHARPHRHAPPHRETSSPDSSRRATSSCISDITTAASSVGGAFATRNVSTLFHGTGSGTGRRLHNSCPETNFKFSYAVFRQSKYAEKCPVPQAELQMEPTSRLAL
jgi:hypothetical protein